MLKEQENVLRVADVRCPPERCSAVGVGQVDVGARGEQRFKGNLGLLLVEAHDCFV
jgi:hypothetical protein